VAAFWGVVVGGLLTICGQLAAEAWKAHVAKTERTERREITKREYQRQAAARLSDAALAYQHALADYERASVPTTALEEQLRATRAAHVAALYRVDSSDCRNKFTVWETAALAWAQGDGPAIDEITAWRTAVEAAGAAERDAL
jgi:hypothetical protein